MYTAVLVVHSVLRYVVLALGLAVLVRALSGLAGSKTWSPADTRWGRLFVVSLDVEVLLGLGLYFSLSPLTQVALTDMRAAAHNPLLRFWAFEHVTMMVLAVVAAHVGLILARRALADARKVRAVAICFMLALVFIVAAIPWPGTKVARPLWPSALGVPQATALTPLPAAGD